MKSLYTLFLILIFNLFSPILTHAQESQEEQSIADQLVEMADEIMKSTKAMIDARGIYEQAADMDTTHLYANYKTGEFYLKTVDREKAVKFFLRVQEIDPDFRFDLLYMIGQSYQYGYEFRKAISFYEKYLERKSWDINYAGRDVVPTDVVQRKIKQCQQALSFSEIPLAFNIQKIGSEINSDSHDFAPVFNANEDVMVFTSRRREGNVNPNVFEDNFPYEDIYIAHKKGGEWQKAQNIGENINTKFHDSNLALSADGKRLFLYRDFNGGDIFYSDQDENGQWGKPKPLEGRVNSSFSENSISISPDGNLLFFSSDRPGGFGGFDIYLARKNKKGKWTKIENLGEGINTSFDEDSPFLNYDGKALYFSSKGHGGAGGYDIFKAEYDSEAEAWTKPENLGFPVNTPDNDIYFVSTKNGENAYYSSVRPQGLGYTDIYMLKLPTKDQEISEEKKEEILSKVEKTHVKSSLRIVLKNSKNQQTIKQGMIRLTHKTKGSQNLNKSNEGAYYAFDIEQNQDEVYTVSVQSKGFMYQDKEISVSLAELKNLEEKEIYLKPIAVGDVVVLRNVYFKYNSDRIKENSLASLEALITLLKKNKGVSVEIGGHSDNVGSEQMNIRMSELRAKSVADYIGLQGIKAHRLKYVGYGDQFPIASNDDEKDGRELNRRVEFKVIGL